MDDKTLSTVFDLRSPAPGALGEHALSRAHAAAHATHTHGAPGAAPSPRTPAPAYSALPRADADFFCAPLLDGRPGEVELVSADGRRFLVHRKVLEAETVFFHIYYGFVPVWRLQQAEARTAPAPAPAAPNLGSLLCLPKLLSTLTRAALPAPSASPPPSSEMHDAGPSAPRGLAHLASAAAHEPLSPPPPFSALPPALSALPPAPAPAAAPTCSTGAAALGEPVAAPTPTTDPYTWAVPEPSTILLAFLSLIYPAHALAPSADARAALADVAALGRVARAALGYQCAKALNGVRERLARAPRHAAVDVYATAHFFKFADLAVLASRAAADADPAAWGADARALMGSHGAARLLALREARIAALRAILDDAPLVPGDDADAIELDPVAAATDGPDGPDGPDAALRAHARACPRRPMAEHLWAATRARVAGALQPGSDLAELLAADVRGGHCGDCLALVGAAARRCIVRARDVPQTI